jgi:hypothetical protein
VEAELAKVQRAYEEADEVTFKELQGEIRFARKILNLPKYLASDEVLVKKRKRQEEEDNEW